MQNKRNSCKANTRKKVVMRYPPRTGDRLFLKRNKEQFSFKPRRLVQPSHCYPDKSAHFLKHFRFEPRDSLPSSLKFLPKSAAICGDNFDQQIGKQSRFCVGRKKSLPAVLLLRRLCPLASDCCSKHPEGGGELLEILQ